MSKMWWLIGGLAAVGILSSIGNEEDKSAARESSSQPKHSAKNDPVNAATSMCNVFDSTGMITECDVSGWDAAVDVRIDTSGGEARKICRESAKMVSQETNAFSSGDRTWELRIFSPYSGDHPIAKCDLY